MNVMKKFKLIYGMMAAMFLATSCTDFVDPAIPYNEFETGLYLRTMELRSGTFNYFDFNNAQFSVRLEVVDEKNGRNLEQVEVFVLHRRSITVTPEAAILTIPKSAFTTTDSSKYLRANLTISATAALAAVGKTFADINGGDSFDFRLVATDNKGRTFTSGQSSGDISGGAYFRSPFFYRVNVVCPSALAGTYNYSTVGWCGTTATGTNTWTATTTPGRYSLDDFSMGAYDACYGAGSTLPGGTLLVTDACGKLAPIGLSRWGEVYTFNSVTVANGGTDLIIDWENDYGEGGVSTLSRTDGTFWPAGLN
jgi:hypothetical protein